MSYPGGSLSTHGGWPRAKYRCDYWSCLLFSQWFSLRWNHLSGFPSLCRTFIAGNVLPIIVVTFHLNGGLTARYRYKVFKLSKILIYWSGTKDRKGPTHYDHLFIVIIMHCEHLFIILFTYYDHLYRGYEAYYVDT